MKKIVVVFFLLCSFTAFSQKPTGKIVLKTGQHFIIESSTNGIVNQEMMGQSIEMKIDVATIMKTEVTDAKDNIYTIRQTLTNIKSTFSGMGQEKSFDSDKKEDMDNEAAGPFKDKINVPTTVSVTNEGKNIITADTTKTEQAADPIGAVMDMMSGEKDIAAILFLVIPAGKKEGDTWQDSSSSEGVIMKRTYTLNSINKKEASVSVDAVMDINKKLEVQGMEMNTVMLSKISSAVLVDLISNIQKENKSTTDVSGTLEIMGQPIPVTSKVTTITTIKSS